MRKIFILFIIGVFSLSWLFLLPQERFTDFNGYAIGTYYSVKVADKVDKAKAEEIIEAAIANITSKMSHFKEESELSIFNNAPVNEWFDVSEELMIVLLEAERVNQKSNGFFDVTIGELINLWGFGSKHKDRTEVPSDAAIKEAKEISGFNHLHLDPKNHKIKKDVSLKINLAAIAKGYLVDKIAEGFEEMGLGNFMVEVGGETRVKGYRNLRKRERWRIGVETPTYDEQKIAKIIKINDISVATSGDYRNFFEYEGKHYSHTINPKSGFSVAHHIVSASVFDKSCMTADAYATSILAMGEEFALQWIKDNNLAVILYYRKPDGSFEEYVSDKALDYINEL